MYINITKVQDIMKMRGRFFEWVNYVSYDWVIIRIIYIYAKIDLELLGKWTFCAYYTGSKMGGPGQEQLCLQPTASSKADVEFQMETRCWPV